MKGRVLVIDDEPGLLGLFCDLLTGAGYQVTGAPSPPVALELLRDRPFDVVLSDINMPGMNGISLLKAVRAKDPDLPVLLVTGHPTVETAIQALERGAVQYLLKPVAGGVLTAAVDRALRLRRMALLRREAMGYLSGHVTAAADRSALEASFERALSSVFMAYQPILLAKDGTLYGHEALLRSGESSLPHPAAVLGAAERLGRVADVGRATRGLVATALESARLEESVFVNIHSLDLADDSLLSPDAPLSAWASRVVIEVTERASLEIVPDARGRIRGLREMGFRIAVDDLGAGYAGLNSFAVLEPEVVKLDTTLVSGSHAEPVKRKLIGSLCNLCHDLGILVVAEGIETLEDRDAVVSLGCDLMQGFLWGRPVPEPSRDAAPR